MREKKKKKTLQFFLCIQHDRLVWKVNVEAQSQVFPSLKISWVLPTIVELRIGSKGENKNLKKERKSERKGEKQKGSFSQRRN